MLRSRWSETPATRRFGRFVSRVTTYSVFCYLSSLQVPFGRAGFHFSFRSHRLAISRLVRSSGHCVFARFVCPPPHTHTLFVPYCFKEARRNAIARCRRSAETEVLLAIYGVSVWLDRRSWYVRRTCLRQRLGRARSSCAGFSSFKRWRVPSGWDAFTVKEPCHTQDTHHVTMRKLLPLLLPVVDCYDHASLVSCLAVVFIF